MEVSILIDDEFEQKVDPVFLKRVAELVLDDARQKDNIEIELVVTGDDQIRQLNSEYRDIDTTTDVLSFAMANEPPLAKGEPPAFTWPDDGVEHLGEVVISFPQAARQAEEHGCSITREIATLIIHGVLHLLGYDHEEEKEAFDMEQKEELLLKRAEEFK